MQCRDQYLLAQTQESEPIGKLAIDISYKPNIVIGAIKIIGYSGWQSEWYKDTMTNETIQLLKQ